MTSHSTALPLRWKLVTHCTLLHRASPITVLGVLLYYAVRTILALLLLWTLHILLFISHSMVELLQLHHLLLYYITY